MLPLGSRLNSIWTELVIERCGKAVGGLKNMTVHKMSMMIRATILGAVKAVYVDSNSPDVLHQGYSSVLGLR